ncbi:Cationic amino acid transporter 9, chloroplastic [Linum perenne]
MLDYHIGAASIARSLASYVATLLELSPVFRGLPNWVGTGEEFFGGTVSINVLAPVLLALLTIILSEAFRSKGLKFVTVLISIGAVAGLTTTLLVGLYVQTGYSVVSACVVTLRWNDKHEGQVSSRWATGWHEGVICLVIVACCGFVTGVSYRYDASFIFMIIAVVYRDPPGFSCPGVPILPAVSIFFNIFLFAQLHEEAWVRFVVLSIVMVVVYASYGQYHAKPGMDETIVYHRADAEEASF